MGCLIQPRHCWQDIFYIGIGLKTCIFITAIFDGTNDVIVHLIKQNLLSLHDNVMSIISDDGFPYGVNCTAEYPAIYISQQGLECHLLFMVNIDYWFLLPVRVFSLNSSSKSSQLLIQSPKVYLLSRDPNIRTSSSLTPLADMKVIHSFNVGKPNGMILNIHWSVAGIDSMLYIFLIYV